MGICLYKLQGGIFHGLNLRKEKLHLGDLFKI